MTRKLQFAQANINLLQQYEIALKDERIKRSNQYGQNSTILYRRRLFRLDPSVSGFVFNRKSLYPSQILTQYRSLIKTLYS